MFFIFPQVLPFKIYRSLFLSLTAWTHLVSVAYNWEVVKIWIISLLPGEIVIWLNFIGLSMNYNQQLPYMV